ncbi:uncharacterized protein [Linepithema humile]|uniref:uncharacterized protein n=1 Tax=Linepithema humile TaxID=83485 RepID=UPI0006235F09|nr:PREDICTED: uncharacterized protein LOC105674797 [Linepithema humile]XP_012226784.1 PREDICTED: uncharacterized protein LOC105674797 [Linepithema humile]
MTRTCICCKQQINELVSDISLFAFPRDKELRKKWLAAINKKFCGSLRICSRHFREEDFRHSLIGGKRYLKKGIVPSLHLNQTKNDQFPDSQDAAIKENQLIDTVNKYTMETTETKSLSIEESGIESEEDAQLSHIIERDKEVSVGNKCTNIQFISQDYYSKSSMSEKILPSSSSSNEPVKKHKRYLYDIQWEEVSSSPVQARIYWEVVIEKIMQQKDIIKTLRPKVKRLQKKILELQSQIKNVNSNKRSKKL